MSPSLCPQIIQRLDVAVVGDRKAYRAEGVLPLAWCQDTLGGAPAFKVVSKAIDQDDGFCGAVRAVDLVVQGDAVDLGGGHLALLWRGWDWRQELECKSNRLAANFTTAEMLNSINWDETCELNTRTLIY